MTDIKMGDIFDLPVYSSTGGVMPYLNQGAGRMVFVGDDCNVDAAVIAINAYDANQERISQLTHENALLENQLKNATAEIAELKKKSRGY